MYYLCSDRSNWGDEFDVYFGELIDELTYQKYCYLQEKFETYEDYLGFGTNEYYDDFNYLGFEFEEVTDEEYQVLEKFGLPKGEGFIDKLFDSLREKCIDNFPEDCGEKVSKYNPNYKYFDLNDKLDECSFEKFKYYIDKLSECQSKK